MDNRCPFIFACTYIHTANALVEIVQKKGKKKKNKNEKRGKSDKSMWQTGCFIENLKLLRICSYVCTTLCG